MERKAFGVTDAGNVRENNEDSILVLNGETGALKNLFILADGMGGHNAGEIASAAAVRFCAEYISNAKNEAGKAYAETLLAEAAAYANKKVFEMSLLDDGLSGMGTTMIACSADAVNLYYAHVGDSRLYIINAGGITQVTEDHSLVNEMIMAGRITRDEAKKRRDRNIVTRALGTEPEVEADSGYRPLGDGDYTLVCSDGLTDMVDDETIYKIIMSGGYPDLRSKAEKLLGEAKKNGGVDNISIILF